MAKYKFYDGSSWVELAKKSDIPSLSGYATQQWVQNQGYITSSDSCAYATNAGNADTVDSEHASAFAHRGVGNNLITAGNEFNFIPSGYGGNDGASVWINYETDVRDHSGNITEYILGKGNGQQLGTIIHSGNIGSQYVAYASLAGGVAWANVSGHPTDLGDFTNNAGYIKGIDSSMVINALGYTPANSSSLSNYLPTSGGTITNSGSPLLTLKRNTNGGAFIGFKSSNQNTYIWYNGSTSGNALRFSYSSDGGSTSVKKMELDNSGNLEVVGSISEAGTALSSKYYSISNPNNYISGINSTMVVNALGYTPSSFTGYSSSDKLDGSYINNTQNWTSNAGTVTSVSAGTGLSISGTASVSPTINIDSGYKLPNTTEWNNKQAKLVSGSNIKTINGESILGAGNISISGSGGWSTELYMHTINCALSIGGTYFGAASFTYICGIRIIFPDLASIAYNMNYNGPNYDDDLPYVCLIPASGFLYGGGHRYTIYGACYKQKNGDDYIRLAAVSEGGSVEYFDISDGTLMGNTVMTDYMKRIN